MRFKVAMLAAVVGGGILAGCQAEGDAQRQAMIDEGVKSCVQGFNRNGGGEGGGMDGERICTCAMEKMTEGKSLDEIRQISQQKEPSASDLQLMGACLVEEAQRQGTLSK